MRCCPASGRLLRPLPNGAVQVTEETITCGDWNLQPLSCLLGEVPVPRGRFPLLRHGTPILSNMINALIDFRKKLDRADQHIEELKASVKSFFRRPQEIVTNLNNETGECVIYFGDVPTPPPELGVVIGDIAHNLRSCLDHLIWHLVLKDGGSPTRRTMFPIFKARAEYLNRNRGPNMIDGLCAAHITAIEELQPYERRKHDPGSDPLWLLSEISNIDKHRIIPVAQVAIVDAMIDWAWTEGIEIDNVVIHNPVVIEKSAEIARFRIAKRKVGAKLKVKPKFARQIQFGKQADPLPSPDLEGTNLIGTILMIRPDVEDNVLAKFRSEFA